MRLTARFARAWKAFRSPDEPAQVHYHVSVDPSVRPDQIKQVAEEVRAQMLRQAQRSSRPGLI